jgi:hypothetical protein
VRVQRLQEITRDDAIAEGCSRHTMDPVGEYRELWNQINGKDSWESNPWIWAISFRRLGNGN